MASGAQGREALILTGPTASGKTALAIEVARRLDGEIVSADSRQVYRGMDIGTAKATAAQRQVVPHHGLDVVGPGERYSAGRFARDARRWIAGIRDRGKVPLLVGGTGFFLRALTDPLFHEPPLDPDRRRRLDAFLASMPDDRLRAWIAALDPASAARLETGGGRQRATRALEIALLTGRPLHWWQRRRPAEAPPLEAMTFVLHLPRAALDERIDARVDIMVREGLVDEVRAILAAGIGVGAPGMSATGYPEMAAFLRGEIDLDEAKARIRSATRRYSRRQLTWFRNQLTPDAVRLDGTLDVPALTHEMVERWQNAR